jgi:hypothetical protein
MARRFAPAIADFGLAEKSHAFGQSRLIQNRESKIQN